MIPYDLSWVIEDDLLIAEAPYGTFRVRYDEGTWRAVLLPAVDEIVDGILVAREGSLIALLLVVERDAKRRACT